MPESWLEHCNLSFRMQDRLISGNKAIAVKGRLGWGGGLYVESMNAHIKGGRITGNDAARGGGGIYLPGGVPVPITSNAARYDGGIYTHNYSTLETLHVFFGMNTSQKGYPWELDNPRSRADWENAAMHRAEKYILRAVALVWIAVYPDSTFRPDRRLTRAEMMTLTNRVLARHIDEDADMVQGVMLWPDNQKGAWYYYAVEQATNSHNYSRDDTGECWTGMRETPDWKKYEN